MILKKVRPMFTKLVTTMDMYVESDAMMDSGILDVTKLKKGLKEYQRVIAVGANVREIEVGDLVSINPSRFAVKEHKENSLKDGIISHNPVTKYNFDIILIDNKECLLLEDRDIDFIVEEYV